LRVVARSKMRMESASVDANVQQAFMRWYNAAREIWSDRENPDLWVLRSS